MIVILIQFSSGDKPKPTPIAYARAADRDDTAYPMINLCQSFFDRRGLEEAVTYGKGLGWPSDLQLSNYDNRASAFWVSGRGVTFDRPEHI